MDDSPVEPDTARIAVLATEVRLLAGRLRRRLLEQANGGDFTPSQISVLLRLENEGPQTVTALARAAGVRSQSMGATVAVLEAAGLVAGAPDPADGRQTILSLTDACREWVAANRAAREDWLLHAIQAALTPAEQEQLAIGVALLKRLVTP